MTKTNDFSNGLVGQLLKATAADKSEQQTKTNDFSNGLAGQLLKATAADESMPQKETKDFSNGLIGQLIEATAAKDAEPEQTQADEANEYEEDLDHYCYSAAFTHAEVILDGPKEQLCNLYSNIKSALQKSKAAKEQVPFGIHDVDFVMKEIFPEYPKNCDINEIGEFWNVEDFSFNGEFITITTDSYFDFPENLINLSFGSSTCR